MWGKISGVNIILTIKWVSEKENVLVVEKQLWDCPQIKFII
jgi:hypothetical protein